MELFTCTKTIYSSRTDMQCTTRSPLHGTNQTHQNHLQQQHRKLNRIVSNTPPRAEMSTPPHPPQEERRSPSRKECVANSQTITLKAINKRVRPPSLQTPPLPLPLSMRLAEHLTRIRAWCVPCLPGRRRPDVLGSGIVGMRGSMAIRPTQTTAEVHRLFFCLLRVVP